MKKILLHTDHCPVSTALEPDHHRFWLQPYAKDFFHALLDLFFQGDHLGSGGAAAVDDGQSVLPGNAHMAETESFGESRALHQPGGGNFLVGFERGIAGHREPANAGALLQFLMLFLGGGGVLEKRTGTLAIGVARNDQHTLQRANVAHRFPRLGEIGSGFAALEVPLEIGIADVRFASWSERISDAQKDEASALGRVEDARAVAETAGFAA